MNPQESAAAPEAPVAEDPIKVQNARVLDLLTRLFGEGTFTDVEEPYGLLTVTPRGSASMTSLLACSRTRKSSFIS